MGRIEQVVCLHCHALWQCQVGCGLRMGVQYQMAHCPQCKTIISAPVSEKDKEKTETLLCPTCGGEAERIENIEEVKCPICGQESLISENIGRWD